MTKLTKYEKETIILYNQAEAKAEVYTHDPILQAKLARLAEEFPAQIHLKRKDHPGAMTYLVPKGCICIRKPYSEARKQLQRERAIAAGIRPPPRSKKQ